MKSEAEIRDDIYAYVKTTALAQAINGQIYTDQRPTNSVKEDIYIRVQSATFSQIQTAIVLIRIYVPNVQRNKDSILNTSRERELAKLAAESLESYSKTNWRFDLESQYIEEAADANQHVIINHLYYKNNSYNTNTNS